MQVALATLWSCFPVSASGADMLLLSLLHTSSGSCCSAETNHGLLRSSHPPTPPSCRSHFLCVCCFVFSFFSQVISLFFFSYHFVSQVPSTLRLFFSRSLCFPLVTPKQPSLNMGIEDARRKQRGQDLSEAALLGEISKRQEPLPLFCSSSSSSSFAPSVCWSYSPKKDAASPLLLRWTFTCSTCLIVCVWLRCLGWGWWGGFSLVSLATGPQCGLQMRRKLYCFCYVVIQSRLF